MQYFMATSPWKLTFSCSPVPPTPYISSPPADQKTVNGDVHRGEMNYQTKILSDYAWTAETSASGSPAEGRGGTDTLSPGSCFIRALQCGRQLEPRSIWCNRPGNEMMPKCPVSMNVLISVCQTPVHSVAASTVD